jgi:hypothetical protein
MKTTLDLPDDLVIEIKLRAVREGRKLKDAMADLLRKGLTAPNDSSSSTEKPIIRTDPQTGLPVVVSQFPPTATTGFSPVQIADILIEQEATWQLEAGR